MMPVASFEMADSTVAAVSGGLQVPDAGVVDQAAALDCGGTLAAGGEETRVSCEDENCENLTNEPNFDENVIIEKTQEIIDVTSDSCLDSGLDNLGQASAASGSLAGGDGACSPDEDCGEVGDDIGLGETEGFGFRDSDRDERDSPRRHGERQGRGGVSEGTTALRNLGHSIGSMALVNKAAQPARPAVSMRNVLTPNSTAQPAHPRGELAIPPG